MDEDEVRLINEIRIGDVAVHDEPGLHPGTGVLRVGAVRFEKRRPDESPGMFYSRVADFYADTFATAKPVKALAAAANVPWSTSSQWVFQARKRGLLPPAMPGGPVYGGALDRIRTLVVPAALELGLSTDEIDRLVDLVERRRIEIRFRIAPNSKVTPDAEPDAKSEDQLREESRFIAERAAAWISFMNGDQR